MAGKVALGKTLRAAKIEPCLAQVHLQLGESRLGRMEPRVRQHRARFGNTVVEHGKQLAAFDHHALLHQHVNHLGPSPWS